jgi:hypothetical protein
LWWKPDPTTPGSTCSSGRVTPTRTYSSGFLAPPRPLPWRPDCCPRLAVVTGRSVAELVAQDLLAWRTKILASQTQTVGLTHVWLCLADAGIVEGTLHEALRVGQQSVTELVDRYSIASRAMRDMLIAYLTERSVNIDYSTLRTLTNHLCQLFWLHIERIGPGHRNLGPTRGRRGALEGRDPLAHRPTRPNSAPSQGHEHLRRRARRLRRP